MIHRKKLLGDIEMPEIRLLYWDADVFLSYINGNPTRMPTLEAILQSIGDNDYEKIVTSTISKVEVAWAAIEQLSRSLNPEEETRIDNLWDDSSVVELVDFNDDIALKARELMRKGMEVGGKKLRTNDAIHLASAIWVNATEFNTYNEKHFKFFKGLVHIQIREPYTEQIRMF